MSDILTEEQIHQLVARGEDSKTERKQEVNYTRSKHEEAEFVMDILSLVNAHGAGTAYMLIGVEDKTGAVHDVTHLNLRENNLQQFLRERIEPTVRFSYRQYLYQGVQIGIIAIPRSHTRFHVALRSIQGDNKVELKQGEIYIRDQSAKRPINASDFTLLRNEMEEQIRIEMERRFEPDRPDIEFSFNGGATHFEAQVTSDQLNQAYQQSRLDILAQRDIRVSWKVRLPFCVKNVGTAVARDIEITVNLPEGCWIDPTDVLLYGAYAWRTGFRPNIKFLSHDQREISTSQPYIFVPEVGHSYVLTWTAICDGMKAAKSGTLNVDVLPWRQ